MAAKEAHAHLDAVFFRSNCALTFRLRSDDPKDLGFCLTTGAQLEDLQCDCTVQRASAESKLIANLSSIYQSGCQGPPHAINPLF